MGKSPPDTVMTIEELSKYLKISRSTLYKLGQEGNLPAHSYPRKLPTPASPASG